MRLLLKDFQERAVDDLVRQLRLAAGEVKASPRSHQAAWLTAPTGSGKTLIATAAIERILEGDAEQAGAREARFLWLSDQPELNEQTRKKMLAVSALLGPGDLVVIDSSFDEEVLSARRVHFLNIQKLGKDATLVTPGDDRNFTIWQTLANTIARHGHEFFLFIDEAHRGTVEKAGSPEDPFSIVQKFIKGRASDGLPPIPIIAGISATPERFMRVVGGTPRVQRPIEVPAEDVRASGLLKDFIDLHHPRRAASDVTLVGQAADITMLGQAAKTWHAVWQRWERYCAKSGDAVVRPIFVVQVEDGTAKVLTRTDLELCVRTIRKAIGAAAAELLPASAFAHAFQEGRPAKVGELDLRHLAPSAIVDDPDVRVVFFKTSLNTGWDCPSAETMMSFRTALDATSIAQLVGRMVRTPLARRVEADEALNAVALYLPHYDAANLDKVVEKLTGADPDTSLPVEVRRGEDVVELVKAPKSEPYFAALSALPSYVVPKSKRTSEVRRLVKLAFLLANDEIDPGASDAAYARLLRVIEATYDRRKESPAFKKWLAAAASVDMGGVRIRLGVAEEGELEDRTLPRAMEDVDEQFEEAGKRLGEGLHKLWWRRRVEADDAVRVQAKLEVIALAGDAGLLVALEDAARETTQAWFKKWKTEIAALPEGERMAYLEIRGLASRPEVTEREPYPDRIQATAAEKRWKAHVYVDAAKLYPSKLNKWETRVLERELARKGEVVAWLRNPPRKPWSLTIPYWRDGEDHPAYPDFLVMRRTEKDELVVDLLEPHMTDLADAAAKALGLAKYAAEHADSYGRIEFIVIDGDDVIRLDLADERWRRKVLVFAEGGDASKLKMLLEEAAGAAENLG